VRKGLLGDGGIGRERNLGEDCKGRGVPWWGPGGNEFVRRGSHLLACPVRGIYPREKYNRRKLGRLNETEKARDEFIFAILEHRGPLLNYDDVYILPAVEFERGSDPKASVFPGADYGNEISRVEDANPVQIQGGYDKISGQLANIGIRNDRGDENLSLEITLGRGVERMMHGTDVVGVQVITPQ